MDDLISRQAAIDAVNDVIADYIPNLYGRYEALPLEIASAVNRLPSAQPTIDAEPVKHGKWVWNDKCRRVCSVCENPVAFMLSKDGWHEGRYCPNCGARMDKDE